MSVSIDMRKAHASHQFGEITQILTWVNDERAMVLLPTFRKGAPWYIVCESAAYKYDDEDYLVTQCRKAAEVLGMAESADTWFKIAKIIHDGLSDLIRMPSSPPVEYSKAAYGNMELKADGKTIAREDMRFEKDGATYG